MAFTQETVFNENTGLLTLVDRTNNFVPTTATDTEEVYIYGAKWHRSLTGRTWPASPLIQTNSEVRCAGSVTWSWSGATLAITIAWVVSGDIAYAEIIKEPTEAANLVSAVCTKNTLTLTLATANTSNDAVINYYVYKAPVVDSVAVTMASAEKVTVTKIVLTLSEDVDRATITKSNDGWFVVTETGAGTTYAVSAIAPNGTSNREVILTVADMTASATPWVTVTYAAGWNGTVTDNGWNAMVTDATWVVIAGW